MCFMRNEVSQRWEWLRVRWLGQRDWRKEDVVWVGIGC